jgi:hypothetical protein
LRSAVPRSWPLRPTTKVTGGILRHRELPARGHRPAGRSRGGSALPRGPATAEDEPIRAPRDRLAPAARPLDCPPR